MNLNMTRQDVFSWCRQQYGTEPDYPWKDWNAVLRHNDNNKWYGVIIEVDCSKQGMSGDGVVNVLNVKCNPNHHWFALNAGGILSGITIMNKEKWVSILLCEPVVDNEIKELIFTER